MDKLKELNLRVTAAKAERLKLEPDYGKVKTDSYRSPEELLNISAIASNPAVIGLQKRISDKEAHLATLKERYKFGHPKLIQAQSELQNLRTGLERAILKARDVIVSSYQTAMLTEGKLNEALEQQQKAALALNKLSIPYAVLARDTDADRALYNSVLTRLKETNITAEIAQNPVRVVARPLVPERPLNSTRNQALAFGLLAGLAVGSGIAFVSHVGNRSFNTLRQAETILGVRSLSEIPRLKLSQDERKPALLEQNPQAEDSFRNLRSSLQLIKRSKGRTFLFTSANPGEGKTFCAINCAISFAQVGFKTLIIDVDLRRSNLAAWFYDEPPPTGTILRTHVPNLSALFADKDHANEQEFLPRLSFEQLMRQAAAKFDRVVVDSAPVSQLTRTALRKPRQVKPRVKAQAAGLPCIFADSITREVDIVPKLVQRLRLCDPASAWANAVLASREQPASVTREEALRAVWSSPFNIRTSAADLQRLYSTAR